MPPLGSSGGQTASRGILPPVNKKLSPSPSKSKTSAAAATKASATAPPIAVKSNTQAANKSHAAATASKASVATAKVVSTSPTKGRVGVDGIPKEKKQRPRFEHLSGTGPSPKYHGAAHTLYHRFAQGNKRLVKRQLYSLMKAMVQEGKFQVSSEAKLKSFVSEQFTRFNVDQDQGLSFDEFLNFFGAWLDQSADALDAAQLRVVPTPQLENLSETQSAVEAIFMKFDVDHNFELTESEVRELAMSKYDPALPKPSTEEVDALIANVFKECDVDKNQRLSFDEFEAAYNMVIDGMSDMSKKRRASILGESPFRTLVSDASNADGEMIASRFDGENGKAWVCMSSEVIDVAKRAVKAGKTPLFLDEPPGTVDWATTAFERSNDATVVDMADLIRQQAEGSLKMTNKQICSLVRDGVIEAMNFGQPFVLRLGHTSPDFMLSLSENGLLRPEFFDSQTFDPGSVSEQLSEMQLTARLESKRVRDGYYVAVTSCFNQDSYQSLLKNRLPLRYMQPIQVCQNAEKVALVLKSGLELEDLDDALDEMDRLANLL